MNSAPMQGDVAPYVRRVLSLRRARRPRRAVSISDAIRREIRGCIYARNEKKETPEIKGI